MSDVFMLTRRQLNRIKPYFPVSHGIPRVDDLRVISGIISVIRYGLQWKDAPTAYGPHKTLYNRFVRWSRMGVFDLIFTELAKRPDGTRQLMIDATHLKAHRTAASLLKKGCLSPYRPDERGAELQAARRVRRHRQAGAAVADRRANERLHGREIPAPQSPSCTTSDRRPWGMTRTG